MRQLARRFRLTRDSWLEGFVLLEAAGSERRHEVDETHLWRADVDAERAENDVLLELLHHLAVHVVRLNRVIASLRHVSA